MSENEKPSDPELEKEQREIRQRLIVRVAIAVGLIGAAAISLPLIDKFKSSAPEVAINPPPASDEKATRIIGAPSAKPEDTVKPETSPTDKPAEADSSKDGGTQTETKPEAPPAAEPREWASAATLLRTTLHLKVWPFQKMWLPGLPRISGVMVIVLASLRSRWLLQRTQTEYMTEILILDPML